MAGASTTIEADLNNSYARLTLAEEEEGGIIVAGAEDDEREEPKSDFRYCLVGRFLTDKVINFPSMRALWLRCGGLAEEFVLKICRLHYFSSNSFMK